MSFYNPYLRPYLPASTPNYQPQSNGIQWVQGEEAAKSFMVGAGQSVLLMDSEQQQFYIKSADQSGMPQPLRIFEYKERTQAQGNTPKSEDVAKVHYVTHEELERRLRDFSRSQSKREVKPNE